MGVKLPSIETLMWHLGRDLVEGCAKGRLLRPPYILFRDLLWITVFIYEAGAILGRATRDRLLILAKVLPVPPGEEAEHIKLCQESARRRVNEFGGEPQSFHQLICTTELGKLGLAFDNPSKSTFEELRRLLNTKWSLDYKGCLLLDIFGHEGIGFGSVFPEPTEKMYKQAYEDTIRGKWLDSAYEGIPLPAIPTTKSLGAREEEVLSLAATFTQEHFPELVEPLGFQDVLKPH